MDLYEVSEALEGHYSYNMIPEVDAYYTSKHVILYCADCYSKYVQDPLYIFLKMKYTHILSQIQLPTDCQKCNQPLLFETPARECVQCHEMYRHDEYYKKEDISYVVIGFRQI